MKSYCDEHGLAVNRIGKVIVPTREEDDPQVDLLAQRAVANGAAVEVLDEQQLREVEPEARSASGKALFSPDTAVVDPKAVLLHLSEWLRGQEVNLQFGAQISAIEASCSEIHVNGSRYRYGVLFNAAGQHADTIARLFGVGMQYALIPFRGKYYRVADSAEIKLKHLIYPVPDLAMPFLGIHSVTTSSGDSYFGPSAIPAFGREHYSGIKGIRINEALSAINHLVQQYIFDNDGFRKYTHEEAGRFLKQNFYLAAKRLVPRLQERDLLSSDKVGIRAQLYDKKSRKLEMDFLIERKENTIHLLNAISPAFTSSFEMAKKIVDVK
jgi:L-2-hydroxyglutarate oxidase LhgO